MQKIYDEIGSGGRWNRSILHKMIEQLREGDIVVVWKLDCLSRALKTYWLMEQITQPLPAEAGSG